jgi:hypothetical protein
MAAAATNASKRFGERISEIPLPPGYGSPRKEALLQHWYPEHGLSSYDYANTIERRNKILLQISRK